MPLLPRHFCHVGSAGLSCMKCCDSEALEDLHGSGLTWIREDYGGLGAWTTL